MAIFILVLLAASSTATIFGMGYATAEYRNWLKNLKLNNEANTDKPE